MERLDFFNTYKLPHDRIPLKFAVSDFTRFLESLDYHIEAGITSSYRAIRVIVKDDKDVGHIVGSNGRVKVKFKESPELDKICRDWSLTN